MSTPIIRSFLAKPLVIVHRKIAFSALRPLGSFDLDTNLQWRLQAMNKAKYPKEKLHNKINFSESRLVLMLVRLVLLLEQLVRQHMDPEVHLETM